MAIEWTQRSTIECQAQAAMPSNIQPLALKARGAGKALHKARRRTAGSARQLAPRLFKRVAAILALISAIFVVGITSGCEMRIEAAAKIGMEVQMRIIIKSGKKWHNLLSHAQFAVSRVACKAIHWHPTDGDSDRYSHMAIEWTQRSTIECQAQAARNFKSRWMRAL